MSKRKIEKNVRKDREGWKERKKEKVTKKEREDWKDWKAR